MLSIANRNTILGRPVCRHCKLRPACRPSRLCYKCFNTPKVRNKYHVSKKENDPYIDKGIVSGSRPLDKHPTDEVPGSQGKIDVLEDRVKRGIALWHPLDAGMQELYDRFLGREWWLD